MYARRVSETLSLHQTLFVKPVKRKILTKFYDLQICLKGSDYEISITWSNLSDSESFSEY